MPEIIDPVFAKTSQNASFLLSENERFGLVFVKTGSINSGTGIIQLWRHYSRPGRVWVVTFRLGTGNSRTLFYGVGTRKVPWRYPWNSLLPPTLLPHSHFCFLKLGRIPGGAEMGWTLLGENCQICSRGAAIMKSLSRPTWDVYSVLSLTPLLPPSYSSPVLFPPPPPPGQGWGGGGDGPKEVRQRSQWSYKVQCFVPSHS